MCLIVMRIFVALTLIVSIRCASACDSRPAKGDDAVAPCSRVIKGDIDTITAALGPGDTSARTEQRTVTSWTACPTIAQTTDMLVFDGYSDVCEVMKAGTRVIVSETEQAPATRWLCIDQPLEHGIVTACKWETFRDEPKAWLCARPVDEAGPCRWGPVEYFTTETDLAATARPQ